MIQKSNESLTQGVDIPRLPVNTPVEKVGGYPFPGTVVAAFHTLAGSERFVVEATGEHYAGMLHIFNGGQLRAVERHGSETGEAKPDNGSETAGAPAPPPSTHVKVRHKKRGSEYEVLGVGRMQSEMWEERGEGTPQPNLEPVAWRWNFDECQMTWHYATTKHGKFRFGDPDTIQPLYAAPEPHLAALEKEIKDLKHDLASAEGRAKNATSNCDYWKGQYEAVAKGSPPPETREDV
jgi:hypothetical protein